MITESKAASDGHSPASETRERLQQSERERLLQDLFNTVSRANRAEQELADCEQELEQVYGSTSWRMTLPLRKASLYRQRLAKPRELFAAMVPYWVGVLKRHPGIRHGLLNVLGKFPSLKENVRGLVESAIVSNWSAQQADYARTMTPDQLPPGAHRIYTELKTELSDQRQS